MDKHADNLYFLAMRKTTLKQAFDPEKLVQAPSLINATDIAYDRSHTTPNTKHCNQYWALDYSFSDMGLFRAGRRTNPWKKHPSGEALLYPPQTPYWEDLRSVRPPIHNGWFLFQNGEAAGLNRFIEKKTGYARFMDPEGRLGRLIAQAARIAKNQNSIGFWRAMSFFYAALDLVCRSEQIDSATYCITETHKAPLFSEKVADFLRAHLNERLTLEQIASNFNVSASTLSHRYRAEAGEAPITTLIEMRIRQARNLLLKGQPLKAIAPALAFNDVFHLSKTFKKVEGRSPRQFLKTLRQKMQS